LSQKRATRREKTISNQITEPPTFVLSHPNLNALRLITPMGIPLTLSLSPRWGEGRVGGSGQKIKCVSNESFVASRTG